MSAATTIRDEHVMAAPVPVCFRVAADVERWPDILPHYRHVRFHERRAFGTGRVEMAAWRWFGFMRYPTWWVSEMRVDADEPAVHYQHVEGITRGMIVKWEFMPVEHGTRVRIVHTWKGPDWPWIGALAWQIVIAPVFVSAIATRTLRGVAAEAERRHRSG
ncbi:MAG: SRPBCC family protein [Gemmatimonadetes bacterium]|nr:SRPBCC family protein [Gemmatimonadota bacterium]